MFPKGNNTKSSHRNMSVFLEASDLDEEEAGWVLRAEFTIMLTNWLDPEKIIKKGVWLPAALKIIPEPGPCCF